MLSRKPMNNDNKPSKHYRLYCPQTTSDVSGKGYNTFQERYNYCEENTLEHLMRIGEMMEWYQVVDLRDSFKVIKENVPEGLSNGII